MKNLISCELNMDTGCVELRYADGSMIAIDCTAVEREVADNLFQRSEFPSSYTPREIEDVIFRLLAQWQRRRQQNQER